MESLKKCQDCGELLSHNTRRTKRCWTCYLKWRKEHPEHSKRNCDEKEKNRLRNLRNGIPAWNKGMKGYKPKWGKDVIEKLRVRMKGSNNPNWKGGLTKIACSIRTMPEFVSWQQKILIRDSFKCKYCGKRCDCIHHINYLNNIIKENRIINIDEARLCYELWDTENGISLCNECHKTIHKINGMIKNYRKHGFVIVTWYDAVTKERVTLSELDKPIKELLAKCVSFGVLFKQDADGIIIMHEDSCEEVDFTIIPASWLITIEPVDINKPYKFQTNIEIEKLYQRNG